MIRNAAYIAKIDRTLYILYNVFFISIICSFRYVTSVMCFLLFAFGIARNILEEGTVFNHRLKNAFILCAIIFFLLQAISLLYTHDMDESKAQLRIRIGVVALPVIFLCNNFPDKVWFKKLVRNFIIICAVVMLYCMAAAGYRYLFIGGGADLFFYHALVSPFEQNAVQVSILIFLAFALLVHAGKDFLFSKTIDRFLVVYLAFCLILLSSKLVIIFALGYLVYHFAAKLKLRGATLKTGFALVAIAVLVLSYTANPVSDRFREIANGDMSMVEKNHFSPAVYFNGLQFRVLQWRFVPQILNEHDAWLTGVSIGDAQALLDEKYIDAKMYLGEDGRSGFLGYNTHNQFLESLLQSGIPGLLSYIALCGSMLWMAVKNKDHMAITLSVLMILFSLTDSCLESQYGVVLFCLPVFMLHVAGWRVRG